MLNLTFPVDIVRGASYNPRAISPDALERLQQSIARVGFCKPIIVMPDGLTIAGHQRTKAARALGLTDVPAWVITEKMTEEDEITFNQLHNGTDLTTINIPMRIEGAGMVELDEQGRAGAFELVQPSQILGDATQAKGGPIRSSIARLVLRYGAWGCTIVDEDGHVLDGPHYALVCRQLGLPLRIYRVDNEAVEEAKDAFSHVYGQYNYEHIDKKPFVQSFAQPTRNDKTIPVFSRLYREQVLPRAKAGARVLDFGCGKGAAVKKLQAMGYRAQGIEFFPRRPGAQALDTIQSHALIASALSELKRNGRFDVVICDFVINSVQTPEAEDDVLHVVNGFCKPGGLMVLSGRTMDVHTAAHDAVRDGALNPSTVTPRFLDTNGFTAQLHHGEWFFQRLHTDAEIAGYGALYGYETDYQATSDSGQWFSSGVKSRELDEARTREAIRREFNLEWPQGRRVDRAAMAEQAWDAARALERARAEP